MTKYLLFVLLVDGLIWFQSAYGKVASGKFVEGLGATLGKFASNNPYLAVKSFLEGVAIPNSQIFGYLTMYGELLSSLAIVGGAIVLLLQPKNIQVVPFLVLGLIGASFLNLIFWLSAGWTSPSTSSVNLLMLAVEISGIFALLKSAKS